MLVISSNMTIPYWADYETTKSRWAVMTVGPRSQQPCLGLKLLVSPMISSLGHSGALLAHFIYQRLHGLQFKRLRPNALWPLSFYVWQSGEKLKASPKTGDVWLMCCKLQFVIKRAPCIFLFDNSGNPLLMIWHSKKRKESIKNQNTNTPPWSWWSGTLFAGR